MLSIKYFNIIINDLHTYVNSYMSKKYNVFPDVVFESQVSLTPEINRLVADDINKVKSTKAFEPTNYGWITNKFIPLEQNLSNLNKVLISASVSLLSNEFRKLRHMNIELVRPSLISINPGHSVLPVIERQRWYSGCVWLQTTDQGSHVFLDAPATKTLTSPPQLFSNTHVIKPEQNKFALWPSHIPAGFTPNSSMTETVCMIFTLTCHPAA